VWADDQPGWMVPAGNVVAFAAIVAIPGPSVLFTISRT
jgi:hypothetical protein